MRILRTHTRWIWLAAAGAILTFAPEARAGAVLLVSGFLSDQVYRYDAATGAFLGTLGPGGDLDGPQSITVGPDGLLYICSEQVRKVLRYDRQTFAYIDEFIFDDPGTALIDETGGLLGPTAAVFGPDGNLYVASFETDAVLRYNGLTGAFIDVFVPTGSGGLNGPDAGMAFGPDGHLYVPSYFGHRVLRFDGASGAFIDVFVAIGSGASALRNPRTLQFRYGCNDLLVNNEVGGRVLRYNAATGIFLSQLVTGLTAPTGFAIGPDENIYVATISDDAVRKFDGQTGASLGVFVPAGSGGLDGAVFMRFLPLSGDANCDGQVNLLDLDGFVQILLDPAAYAASHPTCDQMNADVSGNGTADGDDIAAFIDLMICG